MDWNDRKYAEICRPDWADAVDLHLGAADRGLDVFLNLNQRKAEYTLEDIMTPQT